MGLKLMIRCFLDSSLKFILIELFTYFSFWKVFSSFASAVISIRASGFRKFLWLNGEQDVDDKTSEYNFGTVLKETMLNLGPTFIKGKEFDLFDMSIISKLSPSFHYYSLYVFCDAYYFKKILLGLSFLS